MRGALSPCLLYEFIIWYPGVYWWRGRELVGKSRVLCQDASVVNYLEIGLKVEKVSRWHAEVPSPECRIKYHNINIVNKGFADVCGNVRIPYYRTTVANKTKSEMAFFWVVPSCSLVEVQVEVLAAPITTLQPTRQPYSYALQRETQIVIKTKLDSEETKSTV